MKVYYLGTDSLCIILLLYTQYEINKSKICLYENLDIFEVLIFYFYLFHLKRY